MLTPEQIEARQGKLTASRVACLMRGDKQEIMKLWREMVGHPDHEPENLDEVWQVQLGSTTEKLNLDWYERTRARNLIRRGEVVNHPKYDWAAATLDGFDGALVGPIEVKHCGGFERMDAIIKRYLPQCTWQMEVTQTKLCALSVIQGNKVPEVEIIQYDKEYADELMSRAHRFMRHVWEMSEPVEIELFTQAPLPKATQEYNFTGNNLFAAAAHDWLSHKEAANLFEKSKETIKEMVPADAKRVYGYGVAVTRSKTGRILIAKS